MMFEKYDAYKDSGMDWIGEIPEHWTITKLKYLGTSTIGLGNRILLFYRLKQALSQEKFH